MFRYNYYITSAEINIPSTILDYGDGPDYNVSDFYSTTMLDSLIPILEQMQQASEPLTK